MTQLISTLLRGFYRYNTSDCSTWIFDIAFSITCLPIGSLRSIVDCVTLLFILRFALQPCKTLQIAL